VALKCGLTAPKSPKLVFLVYIFHKGAYPLKGFFLQNLHGEDVPGSHPRAKFHRCGFKNVGLQPQKSRKIVIFGINFPIRENYKVHRKS